MKHPCIHFPWTEFQVPRIFPEFPIQIAAFVKAWGSVRLLKIHLTFDSRLFSTEIATSRTPKLRHDDNVWRTLFEIYQKGSIDFTAFQSVNMLKSLMRISSPRPGSRGIGGIALPVLMAATTCHTLKQVQKNATNNLAPFFKSAFNTFSDGVLRFAHYVAPEDPAVDWLWILNSQPGTYK